MSSHAENMYHSKVAIMFCVQRGVLEAVEDMATAVSLLPTGAVVATTAGRAWLVRSPWKHRAATVSMKTEVRVILSQL